MGVLIKYLIQRTDTEGQRRQGLVIAAVITAAIGAPIAGAENTDFITGGLRAYDEESQLLRSTG